MSTLTYHGHSCFEYDAGQGTILIDPFLTGNDSADIAAADVGGIAAVVVTHGHADHWGDTVEIARRTGALVVAPFALAELAASQGCEAHGMGPGGGYAFPFGHLKLVAAVHGSWTQADPAYSTNPAGVVITAGDRVLYHAGDTALSAEMELLGRLNSFDCACLPIGDNFTMGPDDALHATKFLSPRIVVPMHYNTFDVIAQDAEAWKVRVEAETDSQCAVMTPGESIEI